MARGVYSARQPDSGPVGRANLPRHDSISQQTIGLIVQLAVGPSLSDAAASSKFGELQGRVANHSIEHAFLDGVIAGSRHVTRESSGSKVVRATRYSYSFEHLATLPSVCAINSALAKRAIATIINKHEELRSVTQLARRLGCHPVHLARSFRAAIGVDVSVYLRAVKLGAAFRLVLETDLKMQSVSHVAGFGGKANLYRWMQLMTGHPPGFWRIATRTDNVLSD